MKRTDKKQRKEQSVAVQLRFPFEGMARESLLDAVILSGFGFVQEELEAERTALCGARYAHQEQRRAVRAGHVPSSLVLGGRRVEIRRPRARSSDGHELHLPGWQAWSARDPLEERAMEQMVVGVSTRRYARSLEPLPQELSVRGVSKSAVSERFVVGHPAAPDRADAARSERTQAGRAADRRSALRRARGAGGGRYRRRWRNTSAGTAGRSDRERGGVHGVAD